MLSKNKEYFDDIIITGVYALTKSRCLYSCECGREWKGKNIMVCLHSQRFTVVTLVSVVGNEAEALLCWILGDYEDCFRHY